MIANREPYNQQHVRTEQADNSVLCPVARPAVQKDGLPGLDRWLMRSEETLDFGDEMLGVRGGFAKVCLVEERISSRDSIISRGA